MFEFLQAIADWFTTGIYQFVVDATGWLFSTAILLWIKIQTDGIEFAWSVAKSILNNLGVQSYLSSFWGMLPEKVAQGLYFFKIPESINLLLTAFVTRFVMSWIPFI